MSTVFRSHAPRGVGIPSALSLSLGLWEMVTKQNDTWKDEWRPYSRDCCRSHADASKHGRVKRERLCTHGSRQGIYRAIEDEVRRGHDGTGSKYEPLFL